MSDARPAVRSEGARVSERAGNERIRERAAEERTRSSRVERVDSAASRGAVSYVVGRATTDGHTQLRLEPTDTIHVAPGQPLEIRLLYQFRETDRGKDSFHHTLESAIADQRPAPQTVAHQDRWGLTERVHGQLTHRYIFDRPGTYDGGYTIVVEHIVTRWESSQVTFRELREAAGQLRVVVL